MTAYGFLNLPQGRALRPFIRERVVHDLGAGDLILSKKLLKVIAVDKGPMPKARSPRIERVQCYFNAYLTPASVVFISWPVNWPVGLEDFCQRAHWVIYLGSNMDGVSCGYPGLWDTLRHRAVEVHVPNRHNTLIVYGPQRCSRPLLPEERAALDQSKVYMYRDCY